jgi:hypothetical protein
MWQPLFPWRYQPFSPAYTNTTLYKETIFMILLPTPTFFLYSHQQPSGINGEGVVPHFLKTVKKAYKPVLIALWPIINVNRQNSEWDYFGYSTVEFRVDREDICTKLIFLQHIQLSHFRHVMYGHSWCFHVTHTIITFSSCYVRTWVMFSCNTYNYHIFDMLCTDMSDVFM